MCRVFAYQELNVTHLPPNSWAALKGLAGEQLLLGGRTVLLSGRSACGSECAAPGRTHTEQSEGEDSCLTSQTHCIGPGGQRVTDAAAGAASRPCLVSLDTHRHTGVHTSEDPDLTV